MNDRTTPCPTCHQDVIVRLAYPTHLIIVGHLADGRWCYQGDEIDLHPVTGEPRPVHVELGSTFALITRDYDWEDPV